MTKLPIDVKESGPDSLRVVSNALWHYYSEIADVFASMVVAHDQNFRPAFSLPARSDRLEEFLRPSDISLTELGDVGGATLRLLDLRRNPSTRTTKSMPSLIIVARALNHIQATGERVTIVTPSSGNKATALRDAVARAYETGLATPDRLNVVALVPRESAYKIWRSSLDDDSVQAQLNPVFAYEGSSPIKEVARSAVAALAADTWRFNGTRLWHTMELQNYRVADCVRAWVEDDLLEGSRDRRPLHVQAVSSAFGLLGHYSGWQQLTARKTPTSVPAYFLVQHLGTPDMVRSLMIAGGADGNCPAYTQSVPYSLFSQQESANYPAHTFHPTEVLDPTFYTHNPTTATEMTEIITLRGGGGIVVSLSECLVRYQEVRSALLPADIVLPDNPSQLREWSLVMAITGVLNALDRKLVAPPEIIVHASGSFSSADYCPLITADSPEINNQGGFEQAIMETVRLAGPAIRTTAL